MHRLIAAIPHCLTLGNLLCGAAAIGTIAVGGDPAHAALWVVAGLICDLLDGRAARRLGASGSFGAQLDSLADLVSFGVAPAIALYAWKLQSAGMLGLIAAGAIVAAAATRLARFTVAAGAPTDTPTAADEPARFVGLSVTIPAAISLGATVADLPVAASGVALVALALAALMVSQVPYRSFKDRPLAFILLPCAALIIGAVAMRGDWITGLGTAFVVGGVLYASASPAARVRALMQK